MVLLLINLMIMLFFENQAFDESGYRIPSDVWYEIICDWMDAKSLANILKVDTMRRNIVMDSDVLEKRKLYENISAVIMEIQMRNNSVLNAYKVLKTANPNKLIKQYLLGFDGELEHILSNQIIFSLNETEMLWIKNTVISLKEFINEYRIKYGVNDPVVNESVALIFKEFISMQNRCQNFIYLLELLGKKYVNEMREIICGLKLMMQWIALKIKFPGIMRMEQPELTENDFQRLWKFIRSDFMAWRHLLHSSSDHLNNNQLKIQFILQSIDGAHDLIDNVILFLNELYDKYLVQEPSSYLNI